MAGSVERVIEIAKGEVGYDRYKDPERGTKYGRWYEAEVDGDGGYDYGANGVAYCAMFASWVLNQAGVTCAGTPSAYCPYIHSKQNVGQRDLQRGDLILFDWEDDGTDDHIGIVTGRYDGGYYTIEGNVSSGKVLERTRPYSVVCGGVRPDYGEDAPAGGCVTHTGGALEVDGYWGNNTTYALQKALGTPTDGIVSGQSANCLARVNDGALLASSWKVGVGGSMMVKALQAKLGVEVDGYFGIETCKALQRHLGTPVDGMLSAGGDGVMELQRRLNEGASW